MNEVQEQQLGSDTTAKSSTPPFPATSAEYITVLAHFHRAEMGRMAGWRDRIDRTTNWAITGVAAMLSLSLSIATSHHGVLLFAMVLVQLLLLIEARRYRFFDVYRGRVRRTGKVLFCPDPCPSPRGRQRLGAPARPRFAQAAILDLHPGCDVAPAAAQLSVDVPHPAFGLGAENLHTQVAG